MLFLPEKHKLSLIMNKHQTQLRGLAVKHLIHTLQKCHVVKNKIERQSRPKETKEVG